MKSPVPFQVRFDKLYLDLGSLPGLQRVCMRRIGFE